MYRQFNVQQFYVLSTECIYVLCDLKTAIISLNSINWLVFIAETECIDCAVRAEYLKTVRFFILKGIHCLNTRCFCRFMHFVVPTSRHGGSDPGGSPTGHTHDANVIRSQYPRPWAPQTSKLTSLCKKPIFFSEKSLFRCTLMLHVLGQAHSTTQRSISYATHNRLFSRLTFLHIVARGGTLLRVTRYETPVPLGIRNSNSRDCGLTKRNKCSSYVRTEWRWRECIHRARLECVNISTGTRFVLGVKINASW
jgi:hypothetical protein